MKSNCLSPLPRYRQIAVDAEFLETVNPAAIPFVITVEVQDPFKGATPLSF
jgi:hypothetical protein